MLSFKEYLTENLNLDSEQYNGLIDLVRGYLTFVVGAKDDETSLRKALRSPRGLAEGMYEDDWYIVGEDEYDTRQLTKFIEANVAAIVNNTKK